MPSTKDDSQPQPKTKKSIPPRRLGLIGAGLLLLAIFLFVASSLIGSDDKSGLDPNQPLPLDSEALSGDLVARNDQRRQDIALLQQTIASQNQTPENWNLANLDLDQDLFNLYDKNEINTQAADWLAGSNPGDLIDFSAAASYHPADRLTELIAMIDANQLLVFTKAACNSSNDGLVVGGEGDLALAYRLEAQDGIICVDA